MFIDGTQGTNSSAVAQLLALLLGGNPYPGDEKPTRRAVIETREKVSITVEFDTLIDPPQTRSTPTGICFIFPVRNVKMEESSNTCFWQVGLNVDNKTVIVLATQYDDVVVSEKEIGPYGIEKLWIDL